MGDGWELTWREDDRSAAVSTVAELDVLLDQIRNERHGDLPLLAIIAAPDGKWMGIGLDEPSVVTFQYGVDPPYFISTGSSSSSSKPPASFKPLVFSLQGHWTEFEPQAAVPLKDALHAVRAFFASGEKPTNINWEET